MSLPTYNSRKVSVNFLGHPVEGLAAENFIEFAMNSDITDEDVGADGFVATSILPDETATATLRLQQNSLSNRFLTGVLNLQKAQGKLAKGTLTIKDQSGSVLARLSDAYIKTAPTIGLGSSISGKTYDWVIFCTRADFVSVTEGVVDEDGVLETIQAAVDNVENFLR